MRIEENDGGRLKSGLSVSQTDCAVRAIAIASKSWYNSVLTDMIDKGLYVPSSGTVVNSNEFREYLAGYGFYFVPILHASHCNAVKLDQPPKGRILAWVRSYGSDTRFSHLTAVIDGVVQDVYDPRPLCVVGYWTYNPARQFDVLNPDFSKANRFPLNYTQALSMRQMLSDRKGRASWVV